ncbi:hypothetical protein H0H92_012146 [Tricholoma furcatifolium]|nr:hypothetical protein H0H92_012146 [Tricholoma furcatifolium]
MSHTLASDLPPASGTLPTDQDNAYAWLHALEQGLTTSNLSQQALSQQISVVQAQLKELLAAVRPAASLPFYDGDHAQGCQFLTACKLYISLNCSSSSTKSASCYMA